MSDITLSDSNPFIRFAQQIYHVSVGNRVMVQDCRIFYVLSGKAELFMPQFHYTLVPGSLQRCFKKPACRHAAQAATVSQRAAYHAECFYRSRQSIGLHPEAL